MDNLNGVSQQSSPQSTVEQTEQAPNKPPTKTNWKYLAIVVVLGLGVGGGIWWYANLTTPAPQPVEISNIQKPTPQQTADTSSWQTYRNAEFGFEVRYPKDWRVEENIKSKTVRFQRAVNFPYISVMALDPTAAEATYCEVRNDQERCETIDFNVDKRVLIDWKFTDNTAHAFVGRSQRLKEFSVTLGVSNPSEMIKTTKDILLNFISTFRFVP